MATRKTDKPDQDVITAWLLEQNVGELKAHGWSPFFLGLPWKFIRPLTQITINARQPHPQPVMVEAAKASSDRSFVATTRRHLKTWAQQ